VPHRPFGDVEESHRSDPVSPDGLVLTVNVDCRESYGVLCIVCPDGSGARNPGFSSFALLMIQSVKLLLACLPQFPLPGVSKMDDKNWKATPYRCLIAVARGQDPGLLPCAEPQSQVEGSSQPVRVSEIWSIEQSSSQGARASGKDHTWARAVWRLSHASPISIIDTAIGPMPNAQLPVSTHLNEQAPEILNRAWCMGRILPRLPLFSFNSPEQHLNLLNNQTCADGAGAPCTKPSEARRGVIDH
jgi:hypothetical protein